MIAPSLFRALHSLSHTPWRLDDTSLQFLVSQKYLLFSRFSDAGSLKTEHIFHDQNYSIPSIYRWKRLPGYGHDTIMTPT